MFRTKAAMLQETSALPSCTLCNDVSLCLGTIIGVNSVDYCVDCFIIWHHLVVKSRVHHVQSCVFPWKHERWQTTEVSPKINNLVSNGHVPHAGSANVTSVCDMVTSDRRSVGTRRLQGHWKRVIQTISNMCRKYKTKHTCNIYIHNWNMNSCCQLFPWQPGLQVCFMILDILDGWLTYMK